MLIIDNNHQVISFLRCWESNPGPSCTHSASIITMRYPCNPTAVFKRQGIHHGGRLCFTWPAPHQWAFRSFTPFSYNATMNTSVHVSLCTHEKLFISVSEISRLFKLTKLRALWNIYQIFNRCIVRFPPSHSVHSFTNFVLTFIVVYFFL